jgi:hypothetical protein
MSIALSKLPNYKGDAFRFFQGKELIEQLEQIYKDKGTYTEKAFLSASSKLEIIAGLNRKSRSQNKCIMRIISKNGKDISKLSKKPEQKEILFDKGTKFEVKTFKKVNNIYIIELKEK